MPFTFGIDVSHHQGKIDWDRVARSGIGFALAKATEGTSFVDERFADNLADIQRVGIQPGAYHFLHDGDGARQARHFLDVVEAPNGLLLALDVERLKPRPTASDVLDFAEEFASRTDGHPLIIYTGQTFWHLITRDAHGRDLDGRSAGWTLWDCGNGERPNVYVPGFGSLTSLFAQVRTARFPGYGGWQPDDRRFLQFTDFADVPGVAFQAPNPAKHRKGFGVDADVFFGDSAELSRLAGAPSGASAAHPNTEHPTTEHPNTGQPNPAPRTSLRPGASTPPTHPVTHPPVRNHPPREKKMFIAHVRNGNAQFLVTDDGKRPIADIVESRALSTVLGDPVEVSDQTLNTFPTITRPVPTS